VGEAIDDVRLLRISEVAELLRISRTKVYELVANGDIPSLHVGRSRRVPVRALAEWINERTTRTQPGPAKVVVALPSPAAPSTSTLRSSRASRGRIRSHSRNTHATSASRPFFRPWMPHPMEKDEYEAWVAKLDANPERKAQVIEEMERADRSGR
jgi:excisionase family DNA binding protein